MESTTQLTLESPYTLRLLCRFFEETILPSATSELGRKTALARAHKKIPDIS